jgi:hypothetical protein
MLDLVAAVYLLIVLASGIYFARATATYAARIKTPRTQLKLVWTTCVMTIWFLTSLAFSLAMIIREFAYLAVAETGVAISLFLTATVPCGLPFFNRKGIRPVRNFVFIALGAVALWYAIMLWRLRWVTW